MGFPDPVTVPAWVITNKRTMLLQESRVYIGLIPSKNTLESHPCRLAGNPLKGAAVPGVKKCQKIHPGLILTQNIEFLYRRAGWNR